jgi:secondary thiamine-phosphate synthase enzyme
MDELARFGEKGILMTAMTQHMSQLTVQLDRGPDIRDVTTELNQIVNSAGILEGCLSATVVGSTGSLTTIEYEPGVVADLRDAIERLAPEGMAYAHEEAWHDGNGHSHVQAALLGPSIQLPVREGRLRLGTWQQVVVINHDNRSRRRTIEVTVIGTP